MLIQQDMGSVVKTLCRISENEFVDPYETLTWPESIDKTQWCFSPELISIYQMPEYNDLSEERKKLLAFHETINFFSLNIHGEKALIEGLAKNLYVRENPHVSPYLHHFLDEENKHMIYFGRFCTYYAGKIYPDMKFAFPREYAPGEEEFLFFTKVMIFEEIVDSYNKTMADDVRLDTLARDINRLHHVDESRHLAFGRSMVKWLFEKYSKEWPNDTITGIHEYVEAYLRGTWLEYYNPDVYTDIGLADPHGLAERTFNSTAARSHRERISRQCIDFLLNTKILVKEPII